MYIQQTMSNPMKLCVEVLHIRMRNVGQSDETNNNNTASLHNLTHTHIHTDDAPRRASRAFSSKWPCRSVICDAAMIPVRPRRVSRIKEVSSHLAKCRLKTNYDCLDSAQQQPQRCATIATTTIDAHTHEHTHAQIIRAKTAPPHRTSCARAHNHLLDARRSRKSAHSSI